ncbi:DUF4393 domain-containing protein [Pedobacter sp. SG918]|uniref:DUF4393 domain-containing protein n=1 Tax=Pedobacter sp. SG918 TaxID=2587136 RepID=UPI00146E1BD5|nr:DUF4393 domain-containing protein [Pedobacter sp. SG918]NMN37732.1 hypothetical protein [Pedobacter sp. SG918]
MTEIIVAAAATAASKIKENSLLGMLYKDSMQPSVQLLGNALGTVFEFCTTPLLLCKWGSEAAKLNYKKHLDDYAKRIKSIPENDLISVNPQVGVPIMDRLTYITNEEVADLFISLLAKASSKTTINEAHPAYIHLIDRLAIDEARILRTLINIEFIPSISLQAHLKGLLKGFDMILTEATDLKTELLFPTNVDTYLDNLKSLGILDNTHGNYQTDDSLYSSLFLKYDVDRLEEEHLATGKYAMMHRVKGYYQITNFGKSFINSCVRAIQ